jgi:hypothetical protein
LRLELISITLALSIAACQTVDHQVRQSLRWLDSTKVERDVRSAVAAGECRPVAIEGIAIHAPGYPGEPVVRKSQASRVIEGTGDEIISDSMQLLNSRARTYAEQYNTLLWKLIRSDTTEVSCKPAV